MENGTGGIAQDPTRPTVCALCGVAGHAMSNCPERDAAQDLYEKVRGTLDCVAEWVDRLEGRVTALEAKYYGETPARVTRCHLWSGPRRVRHKQAAGPTDSRAVAFAFGSAWHPSGDCSSNR